MITSQLPSQIEASRQFGAIVHRTIAARANCTKTLVAAHIGVDKQVIESITAGEAHIQDCQVLLDLVIAFEGLPPQVRSHMFNLIVEIKELN